MIMANSTNNSLLASLLLLSLSVMQFFVFNEVIISAVTARVISLSLDSLGVEFRLNFSLPVSIFFSAGAAIALGSISKQLAFGIAAVVLYAYEILPTPQV